MKKKEKKMEKKKKSPRRLKFNTVQTVVIGFFGVILGGGILLSLPICNQKYLLKRRV